MQRMHHHRMFVHVQLPQAPRYRAGQIRGVDTIVRLRFLRVHFVIGHMRGRDKADKRVHQPWDEAFKGLGAANRIAFACEGQKRLQVGLPQSFHTGTIRVRRAAFGNQLRLKAYVGQHLTPAVLQIANSKRRQAAGSIPVSRSNQNSKPDWVHPRPISSQTNSVSARFRHEICVFGYRLGAAVPLQIDNAFQPCWVIRVR